MKRASALFGRLTSKLVVMSPEEAELAKLFTNVWRYIKFATANQLFMMANEQGLDFDRIRRGLAEDYPRAADMPAAGFAAGPCLFKDTMQLAAFNHNNFPLGHAAMAVNEGLPLYVVHRLEQRFDLGSMTVGILGMAFKAGSDDIRSSLSLQAQADPGVQGRYGPLHRPVRHRRPRPAAARRGDGPVGPARGGGAASGVPGTGGRQAGCRYLGRARERRPGMTERPRVSVVVPAYNEGEQVVSVLDRLFESVRLAAEVLVVVDSADDTTVAVAEEYAQKEPRLRCLVNTYGRGPANAIRFGIDAACAPVVVVTMADGCDDARQIDELVRLVERGVAVAAASRYMPGGQQVGGPVLKGALSRLAGRSLRILAHVGTRDATNSFKAYSTEFVRQVGIDSRDGFEIGIELTAKAKRLRLPVAEIPTIWLDRQAGVSNFKVAKWVPSYVRWYRFAFGPQLTAEEMRNRGDHQSAINRSNEKRQES